VQTTQAFVGNSDFLRIFGMGASCGTGAVLIRIRQSLRPAAAHVRLRSHSVSQERQQQGSAAKYGASGQGWPWPNGLIVGRSAPVADKAVPSGPMRPALIDAVFLIKNFELAGALGFEPRYVGTKNRCLTTWRRPNCGGV